MKIDLLYLWVDGNDPEWRAKKDAALVAAGGAPAGAAIPAARVAATGEL
ncbi:MAG: Stealth CR1 domain-containing protein [Rickettsiales bacterium]|jgi:hypothetical protein|nr:Stealth CR1 domain-containing protein [Rickettsiales bacterium]